MVEGEDLLEAINQARLVSSDNDSAQFIISRPGISNSAKKVGQRWPSGLRRSFRLRSWKRKVIGSNLKDGLYRTRSFSFAEVESTKSSIEKGDCYETVEIRTAGNDNNAMRKQSKNKRSFKPIFFEWLYLPSNKCAIY